MSDFPTITAPLKEASAYASEDNPQIIFAAVSGLDILYLGGWRDNPQPLHQAITEATDLTIPPMQNPLMASESKKFTLLPVGVEKYRLLSAKGKLPLSLTHLPATIGAAIEVSDSYEFLRMSGAGVSEFLKLLFTIDVADDVFKAGHVAMTAYHHASVTLHRSLLGADTYILHLPSGTAQSLTETILQTARQFPFAIA